MPSERIPLAVPCIEGREWEYVKACLDTGWVSSVGAYVDRFEREFASAVGARHAVATVNGTSALHVALLLAGVGEGDLVLMPTITFIATANAIRYCGAHPVLLDVDPETWQLDVGAAHRFLDAECRRDGSLVRHTATGRRIAALLPVDILGHPADLDAVRALSVAYGLPVVEDATESLGARYRDRPVGAEGWSTCFSFNGNKLITTGGGGMLVTDDEAIARRARYLTTQAKDDPRAFVHGEVGFNYRLTNVQAAIGCAQLERLESHLARKRAIHARYAEAFASVPGIRLHGEAAWARSALWLSTIHVEAADAGISADELGRALDAVGVETRPLWQPIHQSPAHRDAIRTPCPVAERIHAGALSLPCSVSLTPDAQSRVISCILESVSCPSSPS
jgi:perosamine synthetase